MFGYVNTFPTPSINSVSILTLVSGLLANVFVDSYVHKKWMGDSMKLEREKKKDALEYYAEGITNVFLLKRETWPTH